MITLYSGTPGAGKSLHLASRLYHWMQFRNGPIIGNFACDFSSIKNPKGHYLYIDNVDLSPSRLITFALNYRDYVQEEYNRRVKEGEILLVIDECQLLFNARDYGRPDRREWLSFFTQHRKLGYEIVLVSQMDIMLDKQIRGLIEYEWIHRKVSNFGLFGKIAGFFCGGKLFVAVKIWYPMKEKVGSEFFFYNKKFSDIYDTFALFKTPETIAARATQRSRSEGCGVRDVSV